MTSTLLVGHLRQHLRSRLRTLGSCRTLFELPFSTMLPGQSYSIYLLLRVQTWLCNASDEHANARQT
jgi:hypothetical protein